MDGGGGGGKSTTEYRFPPELRALAEAQAAQTMALGQALPIHMFANPSPAGTAGISPIQAATMRNAMLMGLPSAGLNGLLGLSTPMEGLTTGMLGLGDMSPTAIQAMQSLAPRLGNAGPVSVPTYGLGSQIAAHTASSLPAVGPIDSVFPGQPGAAIVAESQTLPGQATPTIFSDYRNAVTPQTPPPSSSASPTQPASPTTGVVVDEQGRVWYVDPATGQRYPLGGSTPDPGGA